MIVNSTSCCILSSAAVPSCRTAFTFSRRCLLLAREGRRSFSKSWICQETFIMALLLSEWYHTYFTFGCLRKATTLSL